LAKATSSVDFLIGFSPMKFQVVVQWPASAMNDYDEMVSIEDLLIERLSKRCEVDGHDFGSNETNIFVHAADPHGAFEEIRTILFGHRLWADTRIAYRKIDGDKYTAIWPAGTETFIVS
jgi:hypothetical protein